MSFLNYYITHNNFEGEDIEIQVQDLDTLEDPPGDTVNITLTASDEPTLAPAVMESVNSDDDKTVSIKPKRLRVGFNSDVYDVDGVDTVVNVKTFSDGGDGRFLVRLLAGGLSLPFLGNLVLDDNSEAFQPRPNPVQLMAADGLNSLRDVELRTTDGELPIGHYSIIDYIVMCLDNLAPGQEIHVVFNLYEEDSDETTSHTFSDIYLDALTFEKDVDSREDCYTVLTKILDALGCFLCYDHDGWWIIRWDEYDQMGSSVLTHRTCHFGSDGSFGSYSLVDLTKLITHDGDADYVGYRLSMDSAQRRFQRIAGKVVHTYKFEQPKEVPCNSSFTKGTVDDDVLPLKTYDPDCWTLSLGFPGAYGTPNSEMKIAVHFDANDYEDDRYLYLTAETSHVNKTYAECQEIEVHAKDKFGVDVNWRLESNADFGNQYHLMQIYLKGDDGSHWLLGNTTISDPTTPLKWWNTSNFTVNTLAGVQDIDFTLIEETEWQTQSIEECPEIPVDGKLYIWLNQINQTAVSEDNQTINYSDLSFTYIPYINGTYHRISGNSNTVSADNGSRKIIEKEMFISDSPKKLFKGALKKFDGTNYV